jgi:hypothetical protein
MSTVPRIHDALEIRPTPQREDGTRYAVTDGDGRERLRLDEAGRFLVLHLDGLRTVDELQALFHERFGRELDAEALEGVVRRLGEEGLLVREGRGLAALRRLREKNVRYRGLERDRRRRRRPDDRRDADAVSTLFFDEAVYLINEGRLEAALDILQRLAHTPPLDLRVQTIISHLNYVRVAESGADLGPELHDVEWADFDRALTEVLSGGRCPRCEAEFIVELGAVNICEACGASFSACVTELATTKARR